VAGGTLNTCNELHIGYQGTGNLKITNGGLVSTTGGADIATGAGSNGAATVDGTTSQWTVTGGLYVGGTNGSAGGTGLLAVANGGKVSVGNVYTYQSGTLAGNGRVSTTSGTTIAGTLAPNWTLNIDGDLIFNSDSSLMQCTVTAANLGGVDTEVSGAATLNGKLSVTLNGFFTGDFTLLHASTLHNQFASYSFTYTGCLSPSIRYVNGTDVVLHVESTCQ
jgi:T5SS/PEP-CTERM-associated repeat protein